MSFDFPEKIAELIGNRWSDGPVVPGYQHGPCPAFSDLVTLLNNSFFASLKREEDRITQFDLAFCNETDLSEPAFRYSKFTKLFDLIRFEEPRELSVNELVRLAPACNPEKTIILVGRHTAKSALALWGIVDVARCSPVTLGDLRIHVFGPGEMKITLHERLLCTYEDGRISDPERSPVNTGCVYDFFRDTSLLLCRDVKDATGQQLKDDPMIERDYRAMEYLFALQEIVDRMQRLKHGGCILIIPEDTPSKNLTNVTIKYRCRINSAWDCLRGKLILHDQLFAALNTASAGGCNPEEVHTLQNQREDVQIGLRDSLDALAQLTAVDGAVLITRKLELLGFGTVITLPQTVEYKVRRCEDRSASKPPADVAIESYGTRHRSAFEFCYRHDPSVAIIASQDGGIKTVRRVGDHVCFWENAPFDCSTEV